SVNHARFDMLSCASSSHLFFFFSSRRRHTRLVSDWSSDVCSSDLRMNSWRLSSVILPVAVSVLMIVRHSSSVSPTSTAKACRWPTNACISSRSLGSEQRSKLEITLAVMSAGVVLPPALVLTGTRLSVRRCQAMNVLIFAQSITSATLRHEVPIGIGDPFLYVETNGRRIVVTSPLEEERLARDAPE